VSTKVLEEAVELFGHRASSKTRCAQMVEVVVHRVDLGVSGAGAELLHGAREVVIFRRRGHA